MTRAALVALGLLLGSCLDIDFQTYACTAHQECGEGYRCHIARKVCRPLCASDAACDDQDPCTEDRCETDQTCVNEPILAGDPNAANCQALTDAPRASAR